MGRIGTRLQELGLALPAPMKPPGNFRLVKVHAGIAYVAGHAPIDDNAKVVNGFSDLIVELWGEAGRHARSARARARARRR